MGKMKERERERLPKKSRRLLCSLPTYGPCPVPSNRQSGSVKRFSFLPYTCILITSPPPRFFPVFSCAFKHTSLTSTGLLWLREERERGIHI
ncbi:unnamed protein product [Ectocarpus sp. 6 AP-2014]